MSSSYGFGACGCFDLWVVGFPGLRIPRNNERIHRVKFFTRNVDGLCMPSVVQFNVIFEPWWGLGVSIIYRF
jgi:hypothetical protein